MNGCHVVGFANPEKKVEWLTDDLGFDARINYEQEDDYRGELTDASDVTVYRTLNADIETAKRLGFDSKDVSDQSTLLRARGDRCAEFDRSSEAVYDDEELLLVGRCSG
jgi:hypothetical protein